MYLKPFRLEAMSFVPKDAEHAARFLFAARFKPIGWCEVTRVLQLAQQGMSTAEAIARVRAELSIDGDLDEDEDEVELEELPDLCDRNDHQQFESAMKYASELRSSDFQQLRQACVAVLEKKASARIHSNADITFKEMNSKLYWDLNESVCVYLGIRPINIGYVARDLRSEHPFRLEYNRRAETALRWLAANGEDAGSLIAIDQWLLWWKEAGWKIPSGLKKQSQSAATNEKNHILECLAVCAFMAPNKELPSSEDLEKRLTAKVSTAATVAQLTGLRLNDDTLAKHLKAALGVLSKKRPKLDNPSKR